MPLFRLTGSKQPSRSTGRARRASAILPQVITDSIFAAWPACRSERAFQFPCCSTRGVKCRNWPSTTVSSRMTGTILTRPGQRIGTAVPTDLVGITGIVTGGSNAGFETRSGWYKLRCPFLCRCAALQTIDAASVFKGAKTTALLNRYEVTHSCHTQLG